MKKRREAGQVWKGPVRGLGPKGVKQGNIFWHIVLNTEQDPGNEWRGFSET